MRTGKMMWSRLKNAGGFFVPYILILRPVNLIIIALTAYLVWKAVIGSVLENHGMALHMGEGTLSFLIASIVCIAAGGYVINDYFDREMDKVNKPEKQYLGRHIPLTVGIIMYVLLTVAGLAFGLVAAIEVGNYKVGTVMIIMALALYFYSEQFKYLAFWGNFVVSVAIAFVVITMWLFEFFAMVNEASMLLHREVRFIMHALVLGYAAFAFLATITREMVKDRQDAPGDLQAGVRSLPIIMSDKGFKILVAVMMVLNLALLLVGMNFLFRLNLNLAGIYVIVLILSLIFIGWLLFKATTKEDYGVMSLYLKGYMLAGVLSMQLLMISW